MITLLGRIRREPSKDDLLLFDSDCYIGYDDRIRLSALEDACVIIRKLSLVHDDGLRSYIAAAMAENDICKLLKKIASIEGN